MATALYSSQILLQDYSRKYAALQQGYDALRWQMLTTSSIWGMVGVGARLFANQMQQAYLLSRPKLHDIIAHLDEDHKADFAQLIHAASYHRDYSFWEEARFNGVKILSYQAWEKAKAQNDFNIAARPFEKLLNAQFNKSSKDTRYQSLLAQNSRGLKQVDVNALMNDTLRTHIQLKSSLMQQGDLQKQAKEKWPLDKAVQERIVKRILADMGVNLTQLSYREGAHPACFGYYDDVCMSMAYDEGDVLTTCLTAFHEGGHVLYRQNLPKAYKGQAAGMVAGRDMDEAMALIWEHAVSHNHGFAQYLSNIIAEETGGDLDVSADDIYARIMWVKEGYMRGESDAFNYPIQLIQRHGLAEDLMAERLPVSQLKQAFNEAAVSYLGHIPASDREGVLQDPHWFAGEFVDFDNYFMGQNYALQLYDALLTQYPTAKMNQDIARGDFSVIASWLSENIWRYGATMESKDMVEQTCQAPLSSEGYRRFISAQYNIH